MTGKVRYNKSRDEIGHLLVGAAIIATVPAVLVGLPIGWYGSAAWGWTAWLVVAAVCWVTIVVAAFREIGHEEGTPEGEVDDQGYRHGTWTWTDAKGHAAVQIDYQHGRRHGSEKRFHSEDVPAQHESYAEDQKHGPCTYWWPNGTLRCEAVYEHGKLQGNVATFNDQGVQNVEGQFVDGRAHGTWQWYRDDGSRYVEAHYVHGTPHGTWLEWNPAGEEVRRSEFIAGIQHAKGRRYFRNRLQDDSRADADLQPPIDQKKPISWWTIAILVGLVLLLRRDAYFIVPILVLMGVIAIHELGHFLVAKLVGIPIESFRIGVGPTLFQYHWRSTRYELALVPVMGYVQEYELRPEEWMHASRLRGGREDAAAAGPLEVDPEQERLSGSELRHPLRRVPYLLGGVTFNFLAAWILIWVAGIWTYEPDVGTADIRNPVVALQRTAEFSWMLVANTPTLLAPMFETESYTEYQPGAVAAMKNSAKRAAERVSEAKQQADVELERTARKQGTQELIVMFASINLILLWFNLLPVPPLDGFHVVCAVGEVFVGRRWMEYVKRPLKALGVIIILMLIFTSIFFVLRDFVLSS